MSTPTYEGTNPLVSDAFVVTYQAAEDLDVGKAVQFSAGTGMAFQVKATTGQVKQCCGITVTKALSGKKISVACRGIVRAIASAAIAVGDLVVSAANGKVAALADVVDTDLISSAGIALAINKSRMIVGKAISAAAVDGDTVYVQLLIP
jgi:predicted metalloprotease with PDZ domain